MIIAFAVAATGLFDFLFLDSSIWIRLIQWVCVKFLDSSIFMKKRESKYTGEIHED